MAPFPRVLVSFDTAKVLGIGLVIALVIDTPLMLPNTSEPNFADFLHFHFQDLALRFSNLLALKVSWDYFQNVLNEISS